jgi:hypothetical protein
LGQFLERGGCANVVNPMRYSVADQNTLVGQLSAAQVRAIRGSTSNDDMGIDFARRAAVRGIRLGNGPSPFCLRP